MSPLNLLLLPILERLWCERTVFSCSCHAFWQELSSMWTFSCSIRQSFILINGFAGH